MLSELSQSLVVGKICKKTVGSASCQPKISYFGQARYSLVEFQKWAGLREHVNFGSHSGEDGGRGGCRCMARIVIVLCSAHQSFCQHFTFRSEYFFGGKLEKNFKIKYFFRGGDKDCKLFKAAQRMYMCKKSSENTNKTSFCIASQVEKPSHPNFSGHSRERLLE